MVSTAGIAPAASTFAGRRSDLSELRGQKMASVIGLAPIRPGLKNRVLELLCIHGQLALWLRVKNGGWCRDCTHAAWRLTRFSGPGHYCSANHPKWSGWQELHLRPPRSERGRLLLTLHPGKWLPDLDSHQDKRLNRPPCYFDTTWQWRCRQDSHLHRSV